MKLIRADGNIELQRALTNPYVRTIVDIFIKDKEALMLAAELLKTHIKREQPGLKEKLAALLTYYKRLDAVGNVVIPAHITKLVEAIERLYMQNNEKIEMQRGAIVELLAYSFISPRYGSHDFCSNSRRFYDEHNKPITLQEVDVAALSHERRQLEAYECKIKVVGLMHDDCVDLEYLVDESERYGYTANIGVISFDHDRIVERRLEKLQTLKFIKAYGLESLHDLQDSPFESF
jgi:hypothetical protein